MNSKGNCALLDLPIASTLSLILTSAILGSERGNKEMQLADVLSPTSKKKTGRAYVALARAHSEKYIYSIISMPSQAYFSHCYFFFQQR